MDGESHAFSSQLLEIDRAIEDLARSGKLYPSKSAPPQQHGNSSYGAQSMQQSRYPGTSHYAFQRQSNLPSGRFYNNSRGSSMTQLAGQDYGNQYYPPPPPPLQQQYPHSQHQPTYTEPTNFNAGALGLEQSFGDVGTSSYPNSTSGRYTALPSPHSLSQGAPRSYSPFGGSSTLPPLSRLNTGGAASSSHSTTPSTTAAMSSSTSMLPPGYGREGFASVAPGHVHSRAHSVTGSLSALNSTQYARETLLHSRAQSISQQNEQARISTIGSSSPGIFSPSIGHSRAASISAGSTGTASPSTATFNFFSGPSLSASAVGNSSSQTGLSSLHNTSSISRIAPIGRPLQSKCISEAASESRQTGRLSGSGTALSSVAPSSVTSPLSNAFSDGWLDQLSINSTAHAATKSTSMNEAQRKSLQSVWNN